jgi:hypothetical protein
MQLIRGLCDFERLSFVLAYDEGRLTDNLSFGLPTGSADIRARAHLEKLVQMQIPLPQVNRARLQTLLETELYNFFGDDEASAKERMSGDIRFQELAGSMLPGDILSTPRDIKRVTGHTKALATVLQGRVDPIDILGFCALSAKAPSQVADIAIFPEKYSVGPIDGQVANRAGFDDLDSEISGLVRFLFPQDISPQILEKLPKNRICFDEALQAVLQFGVDADLPEISDIEDLPDPDPIADLLPAGSTEIARQLTGAAERGEAVAFLTQVSAAYLPADVEVDEQLWRGLLRGLKFVQADASRQSAETGDVVARIAQMFEDRAAAQPGFHAVDILSTLINGQEWNVSARILRPYWGAEEKPSNSQALEGDDAHNLAFQYALQAKTAHAHNVFLPHLTSIAPILLLIALDVWDHEWRSGLQEALINETAETSARLLDLLFAPDIEIEQTVRHQIIGSDQIVSHLAQLWARRARKKSSNPA